VRRPRRAPVEAAAGGRQQTRWASLVGMKLTYTPPVACASGDGEEVRPVEGATPVASNGPPPLGRDAEETLGARGVDHHGVNVRPRSAGRRCGSGEPTR
jgi:hypothetical protein